MDNIYFSAGPCVKFSGWNSEIFNNKNLNRAHIASEPKDFIANLLSRLKAIICIPDEFDLIFVPGSGSGALNCAFLNFLGSNSVEIIDTGFFSNEWLNDLSQFPISVQKVHEQSGDADLVSVFVDTTSGYKYSDLKAQDGIIIVDAVSAILMEDIPWNIVDVVAFSVQKILGGDGSLGVLAINNKAKKRLDEKKSWPIPRLFNINKWTIDGLTKGRTMSTPSMLALIELDSILNWVESNGGKKFLINKAEENMLAVEDFVQKNDWIEFLVPKENRAKSVVCLKLKEECALEFVNSIALKACEIGVFDIGNFSIPAWRFWIGPTQDSAKVIEGLKRFASLF